MPAASPISTARCLADWLADAALPLHARQTLLHSLGRWMWRWLDGGKVREQLSAYTLIAWNEPNGWVFGIRDCPAIRRVHPQDQLRGLARSFAYTVLSAADVLRFLAGYLSEIRLNWQEERMLLNREYPWIAHWVRQLRRRHWSAMAWPADLPLPGQMQPTNRELAELPGGIEEADETIRADRRMDLDLHPVAFPAADASGRLDKPGLPANRVRQRLTAKLGPEQQEATVYAKWYRGPSKAADQEFAMLLTAINAGIPAAEPLACAWTQPSNAPEYSVMVTNGIPGEALDRWLTARGVNTLPPAHRHKLARHLGRLFGHMHASRIYHRDGYLCHVFISTNPDGRFALRLIDLARAIRDPWLRHRWAVKDLAALLYSSQAVPGVTRTDRLRTLHAYLLAADETDFSKSNLRRLLRAVHAKTAKIARHDAKR